MSPKFNTPHLHHVNIYQDLESQEEKKSKLFGDAFKQIYGYLDPYKRRFYATIILSIFQALIFLVLPILGGLALDIIDRVVNQGLDQLGKTINDVSTLTPEQAADIAFAAFTALGNVLLLDRKSVV